MLGFKKKDTVEEGKAEAQVEPTVFEPKDIDPDLDVSEMPIGSQILAKGVNYTLNKDRKLVK